jgi:hypothetical protein
MRETLFFRDIDSFDLGRRCLFFVCQVFGRFFIFIATVVGVVFFSSAAGEVVAMTETAAQGGGAYRPKKRQSGEASRGHILVLGGGVSAHERRSVECFLKMLCRESGGGAPDIVLLAEHVSDDVKAMCGEHWAQKFNVRKRPRHTQTHTRTHVVWFATLRATRHCVV